jgi:hypothetical protein
MKRREFVGTLAATAAMLEPAALELTRPQGQEKGARMKVGLYSSNSRDPRDRRKEPA